MSFVFNNISERPKADIFSPCVFNNILEDTCIFDFPLFPPPAAEESNNYRKINDMRFA